MMWCVGLDVGSTYQDRVCEDDGWLAFGVPALPHEVRLLLCNSPVMNE